MRRFGLRPWALALCLLVGGLLEATTAEGRVRRTRTASRVTRGATSAGMGRVVYVSSERAYLDSGSDDGLEQGMALSFKRNGRPAGRCTLELVTETRASCKAPGLRAGDTYPLPNKAPRSPRNEKAQPLPPMPSRQTLERRLEVVENADYPLVTSRSRSEGALASWNAEVVLRHISRGYTTTVLAPNHEERLEVVIPGAPVGGGFELYVVANASHWTRIHDNSRFPYRSPADLDVRVLELTRRSPEIPLTLSFGRFWPYVAPGLGSIDGAQVGYRTGSSEVGVTVGAYPEPLTRDPTFKTPLVGAYAATTGGSRDGLLRWGRLAGRVSLLKPPGEEALSEFEVSSRGVFSEWLELAADVQLGLQGGTGVLRGWRADSQFRLSESLRAHASIRNAVPDPAILGRLAGFVYSKRSTHATTSASWDLPGTWMTAGLNLSYVWEERTDLGRFVGGPELTFRQLGRARVTVGYLEEADWIRARGGFAQVRYSPEGEQWSVLGRFSAMKELPAGAVQLGGFLQGLYVLNDWLDVRAYFTSYSRSSLIESTGVALVGELALGMKL